MLWLIALAIDYGGPLVTFYVPGWPRLAPEAWEIGTEHFAERFQLFVIIALGESIVITGATTSRARARRGRRSPRSSSPSSAPRRSGGSTSTSSRRCPSGGSRRRRTRILLARDAYTYLHVVIVAGVLLTAVGDELVIAHPRDSLPTRADAWSPGR